MFPNRAGRGRVVVASGYRGALLAQMNSEKATWLLKAAKSDFDDMLRYDRLRAMSAHQKWFVDEQLQTIYDDAKLELCIIDVRALDNPIGRRVAALERFMERAVALFLEHGIM